MKKRKEANAAQCNGRDRIGPAILFILLILLILLILS